MTEIAKVGEQIPLSGIVIRKIDRYVALHGIKIRTAFLTGVATDKLEGLRVSAIVNGGRFKSAKATVKPEEDAGIA